MDIKTLKERLEKPFSDEELEFRVGATNSDKTKGLALAYVQARAIQNRLDETVGLNNWRVSYKEITGGFIATLEIKIDNEWIAKEDGSHCGRRPALCGTGGGDRQPPCGGAHAHRPRHPGRYTQHERSGSEHQRSRGKGG